MLRPRHILRAAAALLLLGGLTGGMLPAQTTGAALRGSVTDTTGQPLPEAVIQARSDETGAVRSGLTDRRGRFLLPGLRPGAWVVIARVDSGATSAPLRVTLSLQGSADVALQVNTENVESVTVEADAPLVDPERTGNELRISREDVENLPVAGREVTDLALLTSTVAATPPTNLYGERDALFLVNGQSGRSNSFLLDGLDNNDLTSGTTFNAAISPLVIREFVLMTSSFAPEFGRASGGVLNVVTDRGTNEHRFHAFVQGAGSALNEPGDLIDSLPRTPGADTTQRLQTGFKWGGPLKKDKAFLFAAFEHQEDDRVVPFTGVGRDDTAGGWVLAPDTDDSFFLRADFNLGRSSFLMLRLLGDESVTNFLNVGGVATPERGFRLEERDIQLAASLTTALSPNLLHEARLLLSGSNFDQFATAARSGVERPSGLFGGNDLNRQLRDEERLQIVDNLTWRKNAHTFKFGVDLNRTRTTVRARFNPQGSFLYETDLPFEPGDCGGLIVSQVADHFNAGFGKFDPIDCPGEEGVDDDGDGTIDEPAIIGTYPVFFRFLQGEPFAVLNDTSVGIFAQDSWEATEKLQLDYGLRYDYSTFRLPVGSGVDSPIPNGNAGRDTDNVAPRLGFAYDFGDAGRTILRGGAGVFHDKIVLGFPATASITDGTRIGLLPPQGFAFELTEEVIEEIGIDVVLGVLEFPESLTLRFSTGSELQTPYSVQYNLGLEQRVGRRGALRIGASRVLGYHQVLLRDLNPVIGTTGTGIPIHRDPGTGSIAAFVTEGRTWYTGADLSWHWRGEQRSYSASYTWSRTVDMGFDPLQNGISFPPNSDDLGTEIGLADADRRHRLVVYGETSLPFAGLRASGIVRLASETPFNVTTGQDDNIDGVATDRPAGVGRNTGQDTDLGAVNASRTALGLPPVTRLDAPSFAQIDLRLWKEFPVGGGRVDAAVFLQIFNVLGRFNGGPVEGRTISHRFGEPVGQLGPPRSVELGLKLNF